MHRVGPKLLWVLEQAFAAHQAGNAAAAERLYKRVIRAAPEQFDALHLLGVLKAGQGFHGEADRLIKKALAINPRSAEALTNRANVLRSLKRFEEALASCDAALAIKPDYPEALNNRGNVLHDLARPEEALASYDKALALRPNYANALANRADVLRDLKRFEEALASCDRALAARPDFTEALNHRGAVLHELRRHDEALACYDKALSIRPDYDKALVNRAVVLQDLRRFDEALASYEKALVIDPGNADTYNNLGNALNALRRYDGAIANYRRAVELDPLQGSALSLYVLLKRQICDWTSFSRDQKDLIEALGAGARSILPLVVITSVDDPAIQLDAARRFVADIKIDRRSVLGPRVRSARDKIRIAYLSADFRDHTMAISTAELFELHDRNQFETYAFSLGTNDGSDMRRRMERSVDRFLDVRLASDLEIAHQMRAHEIDVAVDLSGFTDGCRPAILAHRPAPIQVNYLGYVGTMGANFIDYIIVDPVLVPTEQDAFFAEKLVHLPECYLPSDTTRRIGETCAPRSAYGLPERGFVFACFNNNYKITPPIFGVWMRLLRAIPDSVLWLRADNRWAVENLHRQAEARGVAADRLIAAARCPLPEHLARHRLADLFLDTLPYTAHSTAVDALWSGLPVLTCTGRSYAARSAGSLLRAIGLADLVTGTLDEYEALAVKLARNPQLLSDLRDRLARNRSTRPLFDMSRFCRHLESAYQEMYARWQRGEPTRSFAVPVIPK
jgi:predicted O-linked N-acetylglucosamine transferase (SPINDLY family)